MNYLNEFFSEDNEYELEERELETRIKDCRKYIENGQAFLYIDEIEETIQQCVDYDFIDEGLELVNAALEIAPFNSELWQFKGVFLNNSFEFEDAYLCFDKSISLNPNDSETLINMSIAEDNLGMFDEAVESLEKALELDPRNEEVYFNLGIMFEKKEKFGQALTYFEKAIEADPAYAEAWYELGYCYETENRLSDSLIAYEKFLNEEPNSFNGWYNKGIVHIKLEEYDKAINCFELSIALKDDFASSWFNCGYSFFRQGFLLKAIEYFGSAFDLDPLDETISFSLGQVYEELGDTIKAIKYYSKAIKLDPEYYEAYLSRGYCLLSISKHKYALRDFNNAITVSNDIDALSAKADAEFSIGNIEQSIISYKKIIESDQENFHAWQKLAYAYIKLENFALGIDALNKCISLKPQHANSYYGKAKINFILSKTQEAIDCLKSAFELDPSIANDFEKEYPDVKTSKLFKKLLEEK